MNNVQMPNVAVGISSPKDMIKRIDGDRGDIPRSRYLLRILKKEYVTGDKFTKSKLNKDSPDNRFVILRSSESHNTQEENPHEYSTIPGDVNIICDAARCYREAACRIYVQLINRQIRTLNLCEKCRVEFFRSCKGENGSYAEAILVNDNDVPLDFNTKTKCTCPNCDNEADIFLEIVRLPISGYYCESCAIDIKLHEIAEEVTVE